MYYYIVLMSIILYIIFDGTAARLLVMAASGWEMRRLRAGLGARLGPPGDPSPTQFLVDRQRAAPEVGRRPAMELFYRRMRW
jgi:hypothetical protein